MVSVRVEPVISTSVVTGTTTKGASRVLSRSGLSLWSVVRVTLPKVSLRPWRLTLTGGGVSDVLAI